MDEKRKVVIYARMSQDRPGEREGTKVERQVDDCRKLIGLKRWKLVHDPFVDNNVSAYSGKPRPQYRAMVDLIKADGIQGIVVWHMDRLYRSPKELEELIDLAEGKDLSILSVEGESMDLTTGDGQLVARILASVAKKSSDDTRRRVLRGKDAGKERGGYHGGGREGRPYGYDFERDEDGKAVPGSMHPVKAEAAIIREVASRALAGEALNRIATDLNLRGKVTVGKHRWRPATIKRLLMSPVQAGLVVKRDKETDKVEIVREGTWPAIISREEHEKLVRRLSRLKSPGARKGPRPSRQKLPLVGLVYCKRDGVRMQATSVSSNTRQVYRCDSRDGGCYSAIDAAWLDVLTVMSLDAWPNIDPVVSYEGRPQDVILADIGDQEARREELSDSYADGAVDIDLFKRTADKIDERVQKLRDELAQLPASAPVVDREAVKAMARRLLLGLKEGSLTDIERNQLSAALEKAIKRITIAPGTGKQRDPKRVRIDWKVTV